MTRWSTQAGYGTRRKIRELVAETRTEDKKEEAEGDDEERDMERKVVD